MTLEEGLVAILAAVAAVLLFLGLAQALDTRPARSATRPRRPSGQRSTREMGPGELAAATRVPFQETQRRGFFPPPVARSSPVPLGFPPAEPRASQPDLPLAPAVSDVAEHVAPPSADSALEVLERAVALQEEGRHAEVVGAAAPLLEAGALAEHPEPSFIGASLWTVLGVSRHAMGDLEGAQRALDAAIDAAPDGVAEGCPEPITALAAEMARRLLAAADAISDAAGGRVAALRMAVLWLEWRIVAAPATEDVSALFDDARGALWDAYAAAGRELIRRREFARARAQVRQALDSADLPASRRSPLAEVAALSIVRQIGRLAATARGAETSESDALGALGRARALLAATSVDALTPARWHAANRRIWNGYTGLGRRLIGAFELEAALQPLFSALGLLALDPSLERKTRELLARTIERISDGAGERITRLLEVGDRDAAMRRWQDVRGIIQKARDQGLTPADLAPAFGRALQILERLEATEG